MSLREEAARELEQHEEWRKAGASLRERVLKGITEDEIQRVIQDANARVDEVPFRYWGDYSEEQKRKSALKSVTWRILTRESIRNEPPLTKSERKLLDAILGKGPRGKRE